MLYSQKNFWGFWGSGGSEVFMNLMFYLDSGLMHTAYRFVWVTALGHFSRLLSLVRFVLEEGNEDMKRVQ